MLETSWASQPALQVLEDEEHLEALPLRRLQAGVDAPEGEWEVVRGAPLGIHGAGVPPRTSILAR